MDDISNFLNSQPDPRQAFWDRVNAFQKTLPRYNPNEDTSIQDWVSANLSQNAMRRMLEPYLAYAHLWQPAPQAPPAEEYYTPDPNSPNFSVNYMTHYPRLFGR